MDKKKLKLIAEALPEIFSTPLSRNDHIDYEGQSRAYVEAAGQDLYGLALSQDNHEKYYTAVDNGGPSRSGSGIYDDGQYDPRHPRDPRDREIRGDPAPRYRVVRHANDYQEPASEDGAEHSLSRFEQRPVSPPSQARPVDSYGRVIIREEAPSSLDRPVRYRNEGEFAHRIYRDPPMLAYDDPGTALSGRDYRLANTRPYQSNRHDSQPPLAQEAPPKEPRHLPAADNTAQQNRIYEVVAQISQQAQQAREKRPTKDELADVGSEDGELRAPPTSIPEAGRTRAFNEASTAAERFLDEFLPGKSSEDTTKKAERAERHQDSHPRARLENERIKDTQLIYDLPIEAQRRVYDGYEEDDRIAARRGRPIDPAADGPAHSGYVVRERVPQPRHGRAYAYDDRYVSSVADHASARERSPELVDRRYKLNNVVYRDERQSSHGTHRTPSRYARYESARLENDRARSRSPVYVKMGPQTGQYRERSPAAHLLHQEPLYRTPQAPTEEVTYERVPPRQEYYRVYADEPRPRQPQYLETFEYVQVSDPQGDYMIRRPVRREAEPVYARYEDETYARQPAHETRATVSRSDPAYYEEYDPRHPAPPPTAPVHQVKYQ